ncbi:hypothetical protein [Cellulomonas hominis]|uniref:hypothetical protein n=1 Tax=Cellulomonas hominis TaxID=156981 RepID=UPI001B942F2C|nr:hypothetical protein [Cellulomonas hominis]VTR77238.1 hypothetical protein CHMI_02008 [Cellulomonas hominis]
MPQDPALMTVTELVDGLRAGASGSLSSEAGVELLIRHWRWLPRPEFIRECVRANGAGDRLRVDWIAVERYVAAVEGEPGERAIARIAAQLAGHRDPVATPLETMSMHPLGWLLASLTREDVDLVLAAIAHAAGSHRQIEHVGEPDDTGRWRVTSASPRLRHASLHPWPSPAIPGLEPRS